MGAKPSGRSPARRRRASSLDLVDLVRYRDLSRDRDIGIPHCLANGRFQWVELLFRYPGALLVIFLAACATWASVQVARQFAPGERLGFAWRLIAMAFACDLFSSLCVHVLSAPLVRNLFDQRVMQTGGPER